MTRLKCERRFGVKPASINCDRKVWNLAQRRNTGFLVNISSKSFRLVFAFGCLLYLQLILMCHASSNELNATSDVIVDWYRTRNESINFTHITYDLLSGRVYAGASNWLFQFNASLDLEVAVRTGPVQDSPLCSPSDCSGVDPSSVVARTNINKVLVIDNEAQMLIACGSVHQGACQRHKLDDISRHEDVIPIPIAANDENSSTCAFIGPSKYFGSQPTNVLYVATTNSRLGPYRDMVPAISSRSLESHRLFNLIEKSFSDTARVDIEFHMKDYFLVKYVYGFTTADFVYFATVQKKSHLRALEEWGYITRLARVCITDAGYHTYIEVTLQCIGPDGTDYTLLQDAILTKPGSDLANDLHIDSNEQVLIGVFATGEDHTWNPTSRSALCVYSLSDIEQKFTENIHMCYNGSIATRNMDYIAGNLQDCPMPGGGNIVSFCSETLKINGSTTIAVTAAVVYENTTLTAVSTITTTQHTVAIVGTSNGYLKKLLLKQGDFAEEFEEIEVDAGNAILADILVDRKQQYIYAASPYKITRVNVERCQHYATCRECLKARNSYCGWCKLEKRCTITGCSFVPTCVEPVNTQSRINPIYPSTTFMSPTTASTTTTRSSTQATSERSIPRISDHIESSTFVNIDRGRYPAVSEHIESSTLVTTERSNLELNEQDIRDKITIGLGAQKAYKLSPAAVALIAIGVIAVAGALLILALVIIAFWHQRSHVSQQYKSTSPVSTEPIVRQFGETRIRSDSKHGFTELHTDMPHLNNLEAAMIPNLLLSSINKRRLPYYIAHNGLHNYNYNIT